MRVPGRSIDGSSPQNRHFGSSTTASSHLRAVLDAASAGYVTTVDRDDERFVVLPAAQLRDQLAVLLPSRAEVVPEGGGWAVLLPGLPVAGDAESFDSALDDAIDALREYAADWNARLRLAPYHAQHRGVVELVELSDDAELRDWLLGGALTAHRDAGAHHPLPA